MVIAHAGHWLASTLYALPILIVLGAIVVGARRERPAEPPSGSRAVRPTEAGRAPDPDG